MVVQNIIQLIWTTTVQHFLTPSFILNQSPIHSSIVIVGILIWWFGDETTKVVCNRWEGIINRTNEWVNNHGKSVLTEPIFLVPIVPVPYIPIIPVPFMYGSPSQRDIVMFGGRVWVLCVAMQRKGVVIIVIIISISTNSIWLFPNKVCWTLNCPVSSLLLLDAVI